MADSHGPTMSDPTKTSIFYRPNSYNDPSYDVALSAFMDMAAEHVNASTSVSPGLEMHNSLDHTPSMPALPTPNSNTAEKRRSKKRPASDNDDNSTRNTSPQSESSSDPADKHVKRQRNTEAARRYRQRKVDRVAELEQALAAMTKERDDLKLNLARSETEVDVLRRLVGKKD